MTTAFLSQDIQNEEGVRYAAYPDPLSGGAPYTIGSGHAGPEVHMGLTWTPAQVAQALQADIQKAEAGLNQHLPWWKQLSDVRQDVLVQMTFQLGIGGLLLFHEALSAMQAGNWNEAHNQMLNSQWAKQCPARAQREATQMLTNTRSWA